MEPITQYFKYKRYSLRKNRVFLPKWGLIFETVQNLALNTICMKIEQNLTFFYTTFFSIRDLKTDIV